MSEMLNELNYKKQECNKCGNTFWSRIERETCGDAPCDQYTFIGNPATDKKYDLYEIQRIFIKFFEDNGHTPVKRYPILAKRWRTDVFLVGASLYDFQPWITSGLVEPPANPLTIAQPSIRLNDVDNVGRTGRHMTCFTMGAHHAFNKQDKEIYWKDNTIKLCHDFIYHIGINTDEITFIESWWQGGGNEGPCYEVCVRGVELATLVFIQYKTLNNDEREEISLRVVDTGYGLERFAWISQGTPTAYDACFAPVIDQLKEITSIDVDEQILAENAQIAGMMDIETFADIKLLRKKLADKLQVPIEKLLKSTEPMEAIYILTDHTRCLAFMLSDGIIPSNVKEGYLARLILRRIIRFMNELNMSESLSDIMKIQLGFLTGFYPEIKDSQKHIMNIINLEEQRYKKTITKGQNLVKRTIKDLKKLNKKELPEELLIEFYDSQGIPPETIQEIADIMDFKVSIPDNFYTLVANKHEKEEKIQKEKISLNFPETNLLFYNNSKQKTFSANILGTYKNNVILNQTIFYPEGGGQPSDMGFLKIKNTDVPIEHVKKINNIVLHKVDKKNIKLFEDSIFQEITGYIDISHRTNLTRNHTATHLIISAARDILGQHIWQAGAQKGVKRSRIDLSHYKRITQEELDEIEILANKYVMKNINLEINWMNRTDAEKKYGFILYQGGIVPGSLIRVVEIPGVDVQACAGTHVSQTGDIGLIKINKTERVQDGIERIDFSAGESAIKSMQSFDHYLKDSSDVFKVGPEQLSKTCNRFFSEWKTYKNEINKLKNEIIDLKKGSIDEDFISIGDLHIVTNILDLNMGELQKLALDLIEENSDADIIIFGNNDGKIVATASQKAIDHNITANDIIKTSIKVLNGGGGGKLNIAQGAGSNTNKMEDAINDAIEMVKNKI